LVNFIPDSKITLFKYIHIVNELETLTGKKVDLVEDGQLKQFAVDSASNDRILIYERKAKG
jgi:predicted nucleotidyltransferase